MSSIFRFKSISGTFLVVLSFFIVTLSASCKKNIPTCQSNKTFHKTYNTKKNRSNYGQLYGNHSRSVKKDYVIKNGIAH